MARQIHRACMTELDFTFYVDDWASQCQFERQDQSNTSSY